MILNVAEFKESSQKLVTIDIQASPKLSTQLGLFMEKCEEPSVLSMGYFKYGDADAISNQFEVYRGRDHNGKWDPAAHRQHIYGVGGVGELTVEGIRGLWVSASPAVCKQGSGWMKTWL